GCELDPLRLAAGELRRGLPHLDVAQTDFANRLEFVVDAWDRREDFIGFVDAHLENVRDGLSLELHFKSLRVVALALADFTRDVNVGEKVHLDLDDAVALAALAPAALDVEREASRRVAAHLRVG